MVSPSLVVPPVGSRIFVSDHFGTVRYVGPLHIDETGKTWLGIDWDDPSRGRHDGSVGGVRYFTASGPKSGSFVKPHPSIQLGIDARGALEEHYRSDDHVTPGQDELDSIRRHCKAAFYEVVGFEDFHEWQKTLSRLTVVDLSCKCISFGTLPGDQLPKVTELVLSNNLFTDWQQVYDCVKELPRLEILEVNCNRLSLEGNLPVFDNIKTLNVCSCGMSWPELMKLGTMFPNVSSLACSTNPITPVLAEIPEFCDRFAQLEELDISETPFSSPEIFAALGGLKNLRCLCAFRVGLEEVLVDGGFPALEDLRIHGNSLKSFRSIDQLGKITALRFLRLSENAEDLDLSPRYKSIVIAKLPQIAKLNASNVDPDDRRNAELDFLRFFAVEWHAAKGDPDEKKAFLEEHPNYVDVIEKQEEPPNPKDIAPLAKELLEVTIVGPKHPLSNPMIRKLPASMVVGKFKGAIARTYGKPAVRLKWSVCPARYVKNSLDIQKTYREFDADHKELSYYISPGDVVVVNW